MEYKDDANWYNSLKSLRQQPKDPCHTSSPLLLKERRYYDPNLRKAPWFVLVWNRKDIMITIVSTNPNLRKASWFGSLPRKFRSITPPSREAPVCESENEQEMNRDKWSQPNKSVVDQLHTRTKDHVPVVFACLRIQDSLSSEPEK